MQCNVLYIDVKNITLYSIPVFGNLSTGSTNTMLGGFLLYL